MNFLKKFILIALIILILIIIIRWIVVITINYKNSYYKSLKEIGELLRIDFNEDNALLQDASINKKISSTEIQMLYEVPQSKITEKKYYSLSTSSLSSDIISLENINYLKKFGIDKEEVSYLNFNYNDYIVEKFFGKEYRPFPIYIYILNSKIDNDNIRIFVYVSVSYRLNCNIDNFEVIN